MSRLDDSAGSPDSAGSAATLRHGLRRAAGALLLLQAVLVPFTYALAAVAPFGEVHPAEVQMFARGLAAAGLGDAFGGGLAAVLAGDSSLRDPVLRIAAYVLFLAAATLPALWVLGALGRARSRIDESHVSLLAKAAVAFALPAVWMCPSGALDFWIYLAWGRMLAAGANPYYEVPSAELLAGLPLDSFSQLMPYGPLWALLSGALGWLGSGVLVLEFLLFKLVIAGAWCASVVLVRSAVRDRPAYDQAVAVTLAGWLPMSWFYAVAEGHNDVVMVAGLLGWLVLLRTGRQRLSPLPLLSSVLIKYVTAPFLILDVWLAIRDGRRRLVPYAAALAAALAVSFLMFVPFARDAGLITQQFGQLDWRILTPRHAAREFLIAAFGLRVPGPYLDAFFTLVLLAPAIPIGVRFLLRPCLDDAAVLVLAALAFVALVLVGHAWPWYFGWLLPVSAVVWRSGYARALLPLFLLAPAYHVAWLTTHWSESGIVAMGIYGAYPLVLWTVLRGWPIERSPA